MRGIEGLPRRESVCVALGPHASPIRGLVPVANAARGPWDRVEAVGVISREPDEQPMPLTKTI